MEWNATSARRSRALVSVLLVLALVLAVPTALSLVVAVAQIAGGSPTGVDAHETMVKVGYWLPLPVFLFFAALFTATVWMALRLKARGRGHP
jgi:hypothetical protein